jgi:hypothetical protein
MDKIISVILLLFIFGGGYKLYARGRQIFKYGPVYIYRYFHQRNQGN